MSPADTSHGARLTAVGPGLIWFGKKSGGYIGVGEGQTDPREGDGSAAPADQHAHWRTMCVAFHCMRSCEDGDAEMDVYVGVNGWGSHENGDGDGGGLRARCACMCICTCCAFRLWAIVLHCIPSPCLLRFLSHRNIDFLARPFHLTGALNRCRSGQESLALAAIYVAFD